MTSIKRIVAVLTGLICLAGLSHSQSFALVEGDITDQGFKIHVADFSPGGKRILDSADGSSEVAQETLIRLLDSLLVVFGVICVLLMVIGAWYMIIAHGQDDLVSRGKSLFNGALIGLFLALVSGIVIQIFTYLLY